MPNGQPVLFTLLSPAVAAAAVAVAVAVAVVDTSRGPIRPRWMNEQFDSTQT